MTRLWVRPRSWSAGFLAVAVMVAACGGGGSDGATQEDDGSAVADQDRSNTPTTAAEEDGPTTKAPTTSTTEAPPLALERTWPEETGDGVTVIIIDRGIDYDHPDFLRPDGTTRIKAILDMSGQNHCTASRDVAEYREDDINAALSSGEPLGTDDYQGHGTATAGAAAGTGAALDGAPFRGPASDADLVIVKATSEGAPASSAGPGEAPFNGCGTDALEWVDTMIDELGQPAVALWNIGVQWGPIDGTSQLSREIEAVFGPDRPGRVWVSPSGDEGSLPNHAGGAYAPDAPLEVRFTKEAGRASFPTAWLSGDAPASVTVEFDDGPVVGPVGPGEAVDQDGINVIAYRPGQEFYPWTSTSGDRGVWINIDGPSGDGVIRFESLGGTGRVDLYGDVLGSAHLTSSIEFQDNLVPGRLNDLAATVGAVVAGVHVEREVFVSETGPIDLSTEGALGDLWLKSSGGPTRDGRAVLDVTAAGQNAPAALGQASYWASLRGNVLAGSDSMYVRFGGASGSAPIVVGVVAAMLEANPELTGAEVKEILRSTAIEDEFTGPVPNEQWGHGKLDPVAAVAAAATTASG